MSDQIMQLNVAKVLSDKMPRYSRYIPKIMVSWLAKTICQDDLNRLLLLYGDKTGADFSEAVLNDLNIKVTVKGLENIPKDTHKLMFASNHPLGGLDGIALIAILGKMYPHEFKFLVNDILMAIPPYNDIFLPINKHGHQKRKYAKLINEAYASNDVLGSFPAGLCSRNIHGKRIEDLRWQKGFIAKSIEYQRDVIPVHVEGKNSDFFYRLAKIRRCIGLKFNLEMIYLPSEIFKYRGKEIVIHFGTPISWTEFDNSHTQRQWAAHVRSLVYDLKSSN